MPDYYKLVGTTNPSTDWTTEVILERDDQGEPSKVVRAGVPTQLTAAQRDQLESLGLVLEASSKSEAEEAAASGAGSDVTGSGPVFSLGGEAAEEDEESK